MLAALFIKGKKGTDTLKQTATWFKDVTGACN